MVSILIKQKFKKNKFLSLQVVMGFFCVLFFFFCKCFFSAWELSTMAHISAVSFQANCATPFKDLQLILCSDFEPWSIDFVFISTACSKTADKNEVSLVGCSVLLPVEFSPISDCSGASWQTVLHTHGEGRLWCENTHSWKPRYAWLSLVTTVMGDCYVFGFIPILTFLWSQILHRSLWVRL